MKTKVLLLEGIHENAAKILSKSECEVETLSQALSETELIAKLADIEFLGIRSKTLITSKVLDSTRKLKGIGAFCIGTNQIDLVSANKHGVAVFNAPYSNTRSVAELVIAELVALSRRLGDVSSAAHSGRWIKSAKGVHEIRGKTLGIVGYGHIGSQVSVLAEALGLKVCFYDLVKKLPMGNALCFGRLEDVLVSSDFVTLHVPETPLTQLMIGAKELAIMKTGSFLLNLSRGTVVDLAALASALQSGHLAGAAIDVFPIEPESNQGQFSCELQGLGNVLLTPHIGGSTEEAQQAIGLEVAESLLRYNKRGSSLGAVNFPALDIPTLRGCTRLVNIHHNVPGVLSQINSLISEKGHNILAQYLATDQNIGLLLMDLEITKSQAQDLQVKVERLATSLRSWTITDED